MGLTIAIYVMCFVVVASFIWSGILDSRRDLDVIHRLKYGYGTKKLNDLFNSSSSDKGTYSVVHNWGTPSLKFYRSTMNLGFNWYALYTIGDNGEVRPLLDDLKANKDAAWLIVVLGSGVYDILDQLDWEKKSINDIFASWLVNINYELVNTIYKQEGLDKFFTKVVVEPKQ